MPHLMVSFANGKGGVGKTTLACTYAAARAREGTDVLLADANEQQRTAFEWSRVLRTMDTCRRCGSRSWRHGRPWSRRVATTYW